MGMKPRKNARSKPGTVRRTMTTKKVHRDSWGDYWMTDPDGVGREVFVPAAVAQVLGIPPSTRPILIELSARVVGGGDE